MYGVDPLEEGVDPLEEGVDPLEETVNPLNADIKPETYLLDPPGDSGGTFSSSVQSSSSQQGCIIFNKTLKPSHAQFEKILNIFTIK